MAFDAPADDPAQVLSELARRRGLRYSRAHVREALERHPEPSSLLALVEVAPSLGLKATAGQAELDVLEELEPEELPTILHFTGPEDGFGLLEAVLPEGRGFRLWDSRHGRRVVGLLDVTAEAVGVQVGEAEAPHRLVVLVHPSCKLCGPTLEELVSLMEHHGAWLCGFVGVAPRDPNDPRDVAICEALATVGAAFGGAAFLQAYGEARRDFARLYGEAAPRARLAEVLGLDPASLEKAREQAGAWVRAATVLKTRHAQGIPAFFLDGRWCEAPLSHVEAWCERPALLELLSPRGDAP